MPGFENARQQFWSGARQIVPLALSAAVYGLAFGLLAAQAGLSAGQVGIMGTAIYAGASQIVATKQLVAGASAMAAALAGAAINLRLLLITASIRDVYAGRPWWQVALGAHLTADENWALMLAERAKGRDVGYWYLFGGGLGQMVIWTLATVAGVVFASAIPDPKSLGLDFAFTAAFIAIARSLWKGSGDLIPWLTAAATVTAVAATGTLTPPWALILGGVAGAGLAAVLSRE